jgi:hypothetical protein
MRPLPPLLLLTARLLWIAVRLLLVIWVGQRGAHFYYQGF